MLEGYGLSGKDGKNMSETFMSQFAEVNGVRLHYVSIGHGKLMMFVHGFPEFWGEWVDQLVAFGRDHQAVAFDMRGYNLSSKPHELKAYHATTLIEDVRALADHLGHRKFTLVAHDWGGAVAWSFATRHPEWLEKLIIINAPHPAIFARELLYNLDQRHASEYMLTLRSPEAERILSENNFSYLMDRMFFEAGVQWHMTESVRLKYIEAWSRPDALTGGLNYYRVSPLFPPTSKEDEQRIRTILDLPREMFVVKVPTLVIWGELDHALLIGNLQGLEDYVEDLTVKRIPDGSHWVVHEQPGLINSLIRGFIAQDAI
jgi:pimeloyl-ACP methyl ester carboxylesterase